jgi:hypothetical protein
METNIRRTYLASEELVAKIHASYELKSVEKFYDFVYDTNDFQLIKAGYLLLLRAKNESEDDSVDDFDDDFLWLSTTNYNYEKNKKAMEENLQNNGTDSYYYMKWNRFDESEDDSEDEVAQMIGEY